MSRRYRLCYAMEGLTAGLCFLLHMYLTVLGCLPSVSPASSACVVSPCGVLRPHAVFTGPLVTFQAAGALLCQCGRCGRWLRMPIHEEELLSLLFCGC